MGSGDRSPMALSWQRSCSACPILPLRQVAASVKAESSDVILGPEATETLVKQTRACPQGRRMIAETSCTAARKISGKFVVAGRNDHQFRLEWAVRWRRELVLRSTVRSGGMAVSSAFQVF